MEAIDVEESCRRCGYPLIGNETYCSHCGLRLDPSRSFSILAVALILIAIAGVSAGTCVYQARSVSPSRAAPPPMPTHQRP